MVRAEFHFLRHFILSPLPVITERSFFPPHPPYRSPKSGFRAFNGPWERVSVKLPHCGAQTRETHITYNRVQDSSFPQGYLSPSEMSFTLVITIYQSCLKDKPCKHSLSKTRSQMPSSFSPNPKPFEICACSVRKRCRALGAERSGLMRGKREENLYSRLLPGLGVGGCRGTVVLRPLRFLFLVLH